MLTIFHLVFSLSLTDFSYISLKDELQPCLFLVLLFLNLHLLYLFETQACQAAVNGIGLTWITNSLSFFKIKGTFTTTVFLMTVFLKTQGLRESFTNFPGVITFFESNITIVNQFIFCKDLTISWQVKPTRHQ